MLIDFNLPKICHRLALFVCCLCVLIAGETSSEFGSLMGRTSSSSKRKYSKKKKKLKVSSEVCEFYTGFYF